MGWDDDSVGRIANIADFIIDIFNEYDVDSNATIEEDELCIDDAHQWDEFCRENGVCGGITRDDIAEIADRCRPCCRQGARHRI